MKGFPYNVDNTPVYSTDMDGNILGMAQSNGTILVNKNISPLELKKNKTISHEKVHIRSNETWGFRLYRFSCYLERPKISTCWNERRCKKSSLGNGSL